MHKRFKYAKENFSTVRDFLRFAVTEFQTAELYFGHGTFNAYDEAVYLIASGLKLTLEHFNHYLDAKILPEEAENLISILKKRIIDRIPAPYLTNEAYLGDFKFYVDERVIIPRSFIADLIFNQFSPWVESDETVHRILDLCTGSGCLAILSAIHFPDSCVDAVDLSLDALKVAEKNIANYKLNDRVRLIYSDVFSNLETDIKYDVIISNPPYVTADSMSHLPKEYLHEPQMALAGGDDGLDIVRQIIDQASTFLTENGILFVEVGYNRDIVDNAFPDLELTWLDTEDNSNMIFMLRAEQLVTYGDKHNQ